MRSVQLKTKVIFFRYFRFSVLCLLFSLSFALYAQNEMTGSLELSLEEAILLAVRENPNIQLKQLNYVESKFGVVVAEWKFHPQFQFTASRTLTRTVTTGNEDTTNSTTIQPSVSLNTPIGTQLSLTSTNNITGHYNPALTLDVIQPLMRGFGRAIVEAELYNAIDSERISRLNIEDQLRQTITAVIHAYLDVISAKQNIVINQDALKRAQRSVKQTKLFIKAGKKPGAELVTVQAETASAQARLEDSRNTLKQKEYALLTAIGLDPHTPIHYTNLDINKLIKKYTLPTLEDTQKLVLNNDINYQISQITLYGSTKRSLARANDDSRWKLDLSMRATTGNGIGGGPNAGINSLTNGFNQAQQAMLTLTIPIDDKNAQRELLQAKIAVREALINLRKQKWDIQTGAINQWNDIASARRSLRFAEDANKLQEKTYHLSFQKYSYGLIDSLGLQLAQKELVSSQLELVKAQTAYLIALVELDEKIGSTLRTWGIKIRLGEECI